MLRGFTCRRNRIEESIQAQLEAWQDCTAVEDIVLRNDTDLICVCVVDVDFPKSGDRLPTQ